MSVSVSIIGGSGYGGGELLRLLLGHPYAEVKQVTSRSHLGEYVYQVHPNLRKRTTLKFCAPEQIEPVDVLFLALPHGQAQHKIAEYAALAGKIVDLSADFRLSDPAAYEYWYGGAHQALELQAEAVYGITEFAREAVAKARLVANPGCYTTCSQLPVIPLLEAGAIDPDEIVIDAKSGVSGAGRSAKEANLFTEVSEGFHAYGVGKHRHMAELEEGFSRAAGRPVIPAFTPHLVPMNRGMLATIYVKPVGEATPRSLHAILEARFAGETFVKVLPFGTVPQTRHVRGSNRTYISVFEDRRPGRAIVMCVLDNLVKGASGQAIQNMNVMMGWDEALGLEAVGVFP